MRAGLRIVRTSRIEYLLQTSLNDLQQKINQRFLQFFVCYLHLQLQFESHSVREKHKLSLKKELHYLLKGESKNVKIKYLSRYLGNFIRFISKPSKYSQATSKTGQKLQTSITPKQLPMSRSLIREKSEGSLLQSERPSVMVGGSGGCDNPFQAITAILENIAEPKHDFGGDRAKYSSENFKKYNWKISTPGRIGLIGEWNRPGYPEDVSNHFCFDRDQACKSVNKAILPLEKDSSLKSLFKCLRPNNPIINYINRGHGEMETSLFTNLFMQNNLARNPSDDIVGANKFAFYTFIGAREVDTQKVNVPKNDIIPAQLVAIARESGAAVTQPIRGLVSHLGRLLSANQITRYLFDTSSGLEGLSSVLRGLRGDDFNRIVVTNNIWDPGAGALNDLCRGYCPGARVIVQEGEGGGQFPGVITESHPDGTFDVELKTGTIKKNLDIANIIGDKIEGWEHTFMDTDDVIVGESREYDARRAEFRTNGYQVQYRPATPIRLDIDPRIIPLTSGIGVKQLDMIIEAISELQPISDSADSTTIGLWTTVTENIAKRIPSVSIRDAVDYLKGVKKGPKRIEKYLKEFLIPQAVRMILDIKKTGDWGQVNWVRWSNNQARQPKTLLVTGDKLASLYSILNGNPTLFGSSQYFKLKNLTIPNRGTAIGIYWGSDRQYLVSHCRQDIDTLHKLYSKPNKSGESLFSWIITNLRDPDALIGRNGKSIEQYVLRKIGEIHDKIDGEPLTKTVIDPTIERDMTELIKIGEVCQSIYQMSLVRLDQIVDTVNNLHQGLITYTAAAVGISQPTSRFDTNVFNTYFGEEAAASPPNPRSKRVQDKLNNWIQDFSVGIARQIPESEFPLTPNSARCVNLRRNIGEVVREKEKKEKLLREIFEKFMQLDSVQYAYQALPTIFNTAEKLINDIPDTKMQNLLVLKLLQTYTNTESWFYWRYLPRISKQETVEVTGGEQNVIFDLISQITDVEIILKCIFRLHTETPDDSITQLLHHFSGLREVAEAINTLRCTPEIEAMIENNLGRAIDLGDEDLIRHLITEATGLGYSGEALIQAKEVLSQITAEEGEDEDVE